MDNSIFKPSPGSAFRAVVPSNHQLPIMPPPNQAGVAPLTFDGVQGGFLVPNSNPALAPPPAAPIQLAPTVMAPNGALNVGANNLVFCNQLLGLYLYQQALQIQNGTNTTPPVAQLPQLPIGTAAIGLPQNPTQIPVIAPTTAPPVVKTQYTCNICLKDYKDRLRLMKHTTSFSNNTFRVCHHCGTRFHHERHLKKHQVQLEEGSPFRQCYICNVDFKCFQSLKQHRQWVHGN